MTSDTERSGADASRLGTYEQLDDGRYRLRFERLLAAAPDRVWAALTDPAELGRWFGPAEVELREGGTITLYESQDEPFSTGQITELDPGRVLEHTSDVHGLMRWELEPREEGTRLVFVATTPMGEEWLTRTLAGWHTVLDRLAAGVAGEGRPEFDGDHWGRLHHRYVEVLGGREWTAEEASAAGKEEVARRRASS
jgi:uncharacterized protein YndB with AHSA1/START domain